MRIFFILIVIRQALLGNHVGVGCVICYKGKISFLLGQYVFIESKASGKYS